MPTGLTAFAMGPANNRQMAITKLMVTSTRIPLPIALVMMFGIHVFGPSSVAAVSAMQKKSRMKAGRTDSNHISRFDTPEATRSVAGSFIVANMTA